MVLHGMVLDTILCSMESLGYGVAWRVLNTLNTVVLYGMVLDTILWCIESLACNATWESFGSSFAESPGYVKRP
jgi:hypothetical protein